MPFPSDSKLEASEVLFDNLKRAGLPWELELVIKEFWWLGEIISPISKP